MLRTIQPKWVAMLPFSEKLTVWWAESRIAALADLEFCSIFAFHELKLKHEMNDVEFYVISNCNTCIQHCNCRRYFDYERTNVQHIQREMENCRPMRMTMTTIRPATTHALWTEKPIDFRLDRHATLRVRHKANKKRYGTVNSYYANRAMRIGRAYGERQERAFTQKRLITIIKRILKWQNDWWRRSQQHANELP